jgi:putative tricarboxylic transport membrane protein
MKIVELAVALVVLALAALGLVDALGFPRASAYLPVAVLGLTCFLSLAWAVQSVLAIRREPPTLRLDPAETRRLLTLAALSLLYAVGIVEVGFFTSTIIFIPLSGLLLGYRDARGLAIATVAFTALLYAVFGLLLRTPLPPELVLTLIGGES